jgi:hypothetical protein
MRKQQIGTRSSEDGVQVLVKLALMMKNSDHFALPFWQRLK